MKIGLITYQTQHRKTEQILSGLMLSCDASIEIYAIPFNPRPTREPLFNHRPAMDDGADPKALAAFHNLPYSAVEDVMDIPGSVDLCLIGGAGLLPEEFVERIPTVNCHPGLIPIVRGLDAFKWAIHDDQPLGISLHLIDPGVDAGRHLKSVRTPILPEDSIESLARRHYDLEIQILTNFARWLDTPEPPPELVERPARKRMPIDIEREMLKRVPDYIRRHTGSK